MINNLQEPKVIHYLSSEIKRFDIINYLIDKYKLINYLEIGVFQGENIRKVKAPYKNGVDPGAEGYVVPEVDYPMTSDEFFKLIENHEDIKYDIVFIDGLHEYSQVKKDIENSLKHLQPTGFIVMHDCNPHSERITHVPRDNGEWCGDVYKFAARLGEINGIDFMTVDADYGCAVVWKAWWKKGKPVGEITWERFEKERKELLRLKPFNTVLETFEKSMATEMFETEQLP